MHNSPSGVEADTAGNVCVTDTGNKMWQRVMAKVIKGHGKGSHLTIQQLSSLFHPDLPGTALFIFSSSV